MKKMGLYIFAVMVVGILLGMSSSENATVSKVEEQQAHYIKTQPVPFFDFSLERDVMIQLYTARNQGVVTHTVWRGDMSVIEGDCPSIGYPIPYDTSLTNRQQAYRFRLRDQPVVIEMPEPNGLFPSKNSIATWVRCVVVIGGKTLEVPIYIEGKVTTYPYPLEVDYTANRVRMKVGATPTLAIKK